MRPKRGCYAVAAWAALLALGGCDGQKTPGRDPSDTADAGRVDGGAGLADAAPEAGPTDADPSDGGSGPSCVVAIDRFDSVGQVAATTQCPVAGPTETCAQLIDCICDFISTPENHERCVWSMLGPRALVALGDFCFDGRDLATVCAVDEWQANGPEPIRARAEPACSAVIAN